MTITHEPTKDCNNNYVVTVASIDDIDLETERTVNCLVAILDKMAAALQHPPVSLLKNGTRKRLGRAL